ASRMQAACKTRAPCTSTTHMRHTATGWSWGEWHRTGISMPALRAASYRVVPGGTATGLPSMVTVIVDVTVASGIKVHPHNRVNILFTCHGLVRRYPLMPYGSR